MPIEATTSTFSQLTDFLVALGTDKVPHTNEVFLAHLIGVYRDLESWGCDEELCRAGMFHSIYGTEKFQKFSLSLDRRAEVRALIGERAERLAYANSAMDRASFDRAAASGGEIYAIADRLTGRDIVLPQGEFDDLCRVHLCDWLEQVPRSRDWSYRRGAYRRLAERLGGVAQEAYARVFALEGAMVKIMIDDELRCQLSGLNEQIEICDEHGRTIGRFLPADAYEEIWLAALAAETPMSKDEIKQAFRQPREGRPLAEIWNSLGVR
jgi:hypothetical protein